MVPAASPLTYINRCYMLVTPKPTPGTYAFRVTAAANEMVTLVNKLDRHETVALATLEEWIAQGWVRQFPLCDWRSDITRA